ncbi:MAG: CAP domain-containing protein [Solirubrobacteraceae bacterium]
MSRFLPKILLVGATALLGAPVAAGAHTRHGHSSVVHRHGESHHACLHTELRPTRKNIGLIRSATLCLINRERITHGERPLRPNRRLRRAAQAHTMSMVKDDYFEHIGGGGPGGGTPLARMRSVGYISSSRVGYEVGENIAWGTLWLATPRAIVASWMASPGHRANILDPRYRETGIGVSAHPPASLAHGQAGAIYTQDFGVIIAG